VCAQLRAIVTVSCAVSNRESRCPTAQMTNRLSGPDPINHVCSLTGKQIPQKCFTYRSVQIFKIIFRRFLFSRIWSSAQDHAVLALLLNLLVFSFPTDRICHEEMICICGVPGKNSCSAGPDLNYFHMIHMGGRWELYDNPPVPNSSLP